MVARRAENVGLPNRWVRKHGAIYYIVPDGMQPYWHHKQWFRLGATEDEAWNTWSRMAANQDVMPDPDIPDLEALQRREFVCCGVYVLRRGHEVVYIGRSDTIQDRLGTHAANGAIPFDSYSVIPAEGLEQRRLEQILIAKHKPKFNTNDLG